jgi:hypothetical protein
MKDKPPVMQAGVFLRNLFAPYESGYIEIRAFNGQRREQSFHEIPLSGDRLKALCESLLNKSDMGFDVYVGVLPRSQRYGKASAVNQASVIWADFDFKNMTATGMDEATEDADILVHSGGGIHAYWYATKVEHLDTSKAQDAYSAVVQDVQQAKSGGKADHTHDLPRILRVPGTKNWKNRQNPKEVSLLKCNNRFTPAEKDKEQPVDTGFIHLLEDEPMYAPLVEGTEEFEFYARLWREAMEQNRLYEAAKKNRLPLLAHPITTPGGRRISDPNIYVTTQMERIMKIAGTMTEAELAYANREIQAVLDYMRDHGHAY